MKKISLLLAFVFISIATNAQINPDGGFFDTLYDHLGNKYSLADLLIDKSQNGGISTQKNNTPNQIAAPSSSCQAGYFRLFFGPNGFDGPTLVEIDRRNVLCQLFTDLSCLITSPLSSPCNVTSNNNTFVNVYIDGVPSGPSAGSAAPIFAAPPGAVVGASLVDCMAQKTIVSGIDGYTGIASPLQTTGNNFYHILMKFNTSLNWYYNLTSIGISAGQSDFYTVALHEALHGLGFVSLLGSNGNSVYSPFFDIYSKYDLGLRTGHPPITPVISSTNISCAITTLTKSPPFIANPGNCTASGNTDFTPFATKCHYISGTTSMTVPVYTPICYEAGSSWSHFEDQWYPSSPYGNNNYFVMCNTYGGLKRFPREEEKVVLCDLGYSTAGQYVSPVAGAPYTYTAGGCSPVTVWGINDGLSGNNITYIASSGAVSIPTTAIKSNDSPNTSFVDCVSFVYNYPGMTLSTAGGSITVQYAPGPIQYCGVVLVQYVPKDINGVSGNITYIYMYFPCGSCGPPNLCDLVQNGGFENYSPTPTCGGPWPNTPKPNCWDFYTHTPDIYTGNPACNPTSNGYHFNLASANLAITNTYNGPTNYHVTGLVMTSGSTVTTTNEESVKTDLGVHMVPGSTYLLSFWAFNSQGFYNQQGLPNIITFGSRTNFGAVSAGSFPAIGTDNIIANFTLMPADLNTWKHYSATIVFNGSSNHKCLTVGQNPSATAAMNNNPLQNSFYTFIDDVSLVEISNALIFTPPQTVCFNTSAGLTNLAQYCNQANAVFSGPDVFLNGGNYDFSPQAPGNYTITASYTNNVGCTYSTQAIVVVPGMSVTPSNTLFCNYLNYTLSITPTPTNIAISIPFWQPPNQISSTIVVPGNNPGPYIASSQYNGCPLFAIFNPTIVPNTVITATPDIWCAGSAFTMNVSAPNFTLAPMTQTWSPPINSNANTVSVTYNNIINPIYSVTTTVGSCTNLATYTATWLPPPTIAITPTNCLPPNGSATLTANSTSTLSLTYTWQPGNFNTQQIVVTPTAPTIYTVSVSSGTSCAVSATISVYPAPQFINVPTSLCSGTNFSYLHFLLAPGTPTTGVFTGIGTSTIAAGGQTLTSVNVSTTVTPGVYTYTYSYLTPAGCFATNTFTINILQGISLSIPNPNVTYCANIAVGATLAAIATPSANVTYTWLPGPVNSPSFVATPSVNTTYVLIASNGSCTATGRAEVVVSHSCCASANYINTAAVSNQTFTGLYAINQDLTVSGNVVFSGEFLVAPNVSITVVPGATLSSGQHTLGMIGQGLHMLSCGKDMWHGIIVQNGGKLVFFLDDLIEDAKEAIVSDGCTSTSGVDIDLKFVAFNRNNISVAIRNYNQTTGTPPFEIYNCVFTCRDLQVPVNSFVWPTAPQLSIPTTPSSPLATPYTMSGYIPQFCKQPYSTQHSTTGVQVENSGITFNPTSPVPAYTSIDIGSGTGVTTNIFDNQVIGITSRNSNINSYYNVFQNANHYFIGTAPIGGIGIYAFNDDLGANHNSRLNLVAIQSPTTDINTFYDCRYGIYAYRLFELNCQFQDFRSLQNSSVTFSNTLRGQFGIFSIGNRYKNYSINNNQFLNVRTGIYLGGLTGPLFLPSIPSFGTYLGKITINENLFSPTVGTVSPVGNGFIYQGVYADAAISTSTNTFYEPGSVMRIEKNDFNRVWRGVYVGNFSNQFFNAVTSCNTISIIKDIQNPSFSQRGIDYVINRFGVITSNTVTGYSSNAPKTAGIYCGQNFSTTVQCNVTDLLYAGFEFNSANPFTSWRSNSMQAQRHGLALTSNGIIGVQGSFVKPSDNQWLGSIWVGPNKHTFTDAFSNALNSVLWTRNLGVWVPTNNQGPNGYSSTGAVMNANNAAPFPVCLSCAGTGNGGCSGCRNQMAGGPYIKGNLVEANEIYNAGLFTAIDERPELIDNDPELFEFYQSELSGNKGILLEIEKQLHAGELRRAKNSLTAFQPATAIEANYKSFYELQATWLGNGVLSASEKNVLNTLAHKCPSMDGSVIYQARALRTVVTGAISLYDDADCLDERSAVHSQIETRTSLTNNFRLYPNPAQNILYIGAGTNEGEVMVTIRDVNQKVLLQKQLDISEGYGELKLDFADGVYFVELTGADNVNEFKKLIITK